jgi:hypothetical protein
MVPSRRKPQARKVERSALLFAFGVKTSRSHQMSIFQSSLAWRTAGILVASCCPAASSGRAAATGSPEGSGPETIVTQARLSLAEARTARSDPRTAVGHYLEAADEATRAASKLPVEQTSEARLIYNGACEEVTVLLWSTHELWNKDETIASNNGYYRLHFATGSRKGGTWYPNYFSLFRTHRQVHEKVAHQEARTNDWGSFAFPQTVNELKRILRLNLSVGERSRQKRSPGSTYGQATAGQHKGT